MTETPYERKVFCLGKYSGGTKSWKTLRTTDYLISDLHNRTVSSVKYKTIVGLKGQSSRRLESLREDSGD